MLPHAPQHSKLLAGPVYASGNYATQDGEYYTIDWAKGGCKPLFKGAYHCSDAPQRGAAAPRDV